MKLKITLCLFFLSCVSAIAQDIPAIDPNLAATPFSQWQWNLTTLLVISMFAGRIYSYLRNNGGLRSIFHAIWFGGITGQNVPKQVAETTKEFNKSKDQGSSNDK